MARRTADTDKNLYEPDLCMGYAALIRSGRGVLGISQKSFAAMLGVHRTTLVRLEQGSPPLKKSLLEAAEALLAKLEVRVSFDVTQSDSTTLGISQLHLCIPIDTLRRVQASLDRGGPEEDLIRALFGYQYVPPLKAEPLRRVVSKPDT